MNLEKLFLETIGEIISSYDLAAVFTKTKTERYLFPIIADKIEKRLKQEDSDFFSLVEYNCKGIHRENKYRKADLAIAKIVDGREIEEILAVVEGKVYFTFDVLDNIGWEKKREDSFTDDINKLKEIISVSDRYFVLFLIHYGNQTVPEFFKYSDGHNKIIEKKREEDSNFNEEDIIRIVRKGIENLFNYFNLIFNDNSIQLYRLGRYLDHEISLIVGIGKLR